MSLRKLPEAKTLSRPQNYQWEAPADVHARWADTPLAAASDEASTIQIFDVIGEDFWTGGGFTAKRMSAALRSIGATKDVVVQINSPGGDLFEGIAIYNLLRGHQAKVSVQVMGWAASAASIIAMAGDDIAMGRGTFMMVHNAWGVVMGNQQDFIDAAALFKSFDAAIADIYAARTGRSLADVQALMTAETFMDPNMAIAEKFADRIDDEVGASASGAAPASGEDHRRLMARRQTESALAKAGIPRAQRGAIINDLATPRDAGRRPAPRDAGDLMAGLRQLTETLRT